MRYLVSMRLAKAARCLEEIGNPTRLEIFRLLVRAGPEGLAVGELQDHLGIPGSTLSHHMARLVNVGLVKQLREGRILRCRPNFALMDQMIGFLTEQCCTGLAIAPGRRKAG